MRTLTEKQIEQVKKITTADWYLFKGTTKVHGNTKKIGQILVSDYKKIFEKKELRAYRKSDSHKESPLQITKRLLNWSLECRGTGYFKILIEGNTGIYYASPAYGHSDYNKSRVFAKTPETLKLLQLFNAVVCR